MMRVTTTCLLAVTVLLPAGEARAQDGAEEVDPGMVAIAKELLRRTTTNAQRASVLFEAAADAKDNKKLRIYLNERALEYALQSIHVASSRRVADYAVSALRRDAPERRDHWYAMRIEILRRHYRSPLSADQKRKAGQYFADYLISYAGRYEQERRWDVALPLYKEAAGIFEAQGLPGKNELAAMTADAARKAEVYAKIKELDAQYQKDPKDAELCKKLALLWIIDMNYPSHGTRYISSRENKTWHDCAHRAEYSISGVKVAEQALQVADWYYKEIVPLASPATRRTMLERAGTYYQHAVALKVGIKRSRKDIYDALAKISTELSGDTQAEWTVIFRSSDPDVWDTDRPTGTLSFAVPLSQVDGPIRYLRMTRRDTGHFVILPMKAMWLDRTQSCTKTHGWQGEKAPITGGGCRWGIYSRGPRKSSYRISITYEHWGWGFGYDRRTNKMVWSWAGRPIQKTSFEVAVTNGDLTPAEAKYLLP